jgi:hypothetical protein
VVIYAGLGVVVARRQPRNPTGWIPIGFILLVLLSTVAGWYAVLYYNFAHHGLPLAQMAVILQPLWAPAVRYDLTGVVQDALEPVRISVWVSQRG